jgi:hypothetical protein
MFLYRLNDDYDPACVPVFDDISFANAFDLSTIPLVSFEMVEYRWKTEQSISIVFRYDSNIYYFLSDKEYPTTTTCRRMKLDAEYDMADHHCDYYAKPILARFLGRFERRLHTRAAIQHIQDNIVMDPTTVAYQEEFLRHLQQIKVDDLHDRHLLQKLTDESRAIVETEQRYRPGAEGFEEARQRFESFMETATFTMGQEPSINMTQQGPLA